MTLEQVMLETGRQMQLAILYVVATLAMVCTIFVSLLAIFVHGLRGKSNCMLYAYRAYRRGDFVMMRKTQWGRLWRWPHFRWSEDGATWWEFVPVERKRRRLVPPLLFTGSVRQWVPLVLVGVLLWAAPASAQLSSGLLACWSMDEASGTRADASVNARTLSDNSSVGSTTGVIGNAADFSGSNYLSLAAGLLDGLTDLTIAFWAKTVSAFGSGGNFFGQGDGSTSTFSEDVRHFFRGSGGNQDNSLSPPYTTTWRFYVIRRTATSASMRQNDATSVYSNTFSASGTITTATTDGFHVGHVPAGSGGGASFATGSIDEVGVWNRSLSSAEETSLYNGGSGTSCATVAGGGGGGGGTTPCILGGGLIRPGCPGEDPTTQHLWVAERRADPDGVTAVIHRFTITP